MARAFLLAGDGVGGLGGHGPEVTDGVAHGIGGGADDVGGFAGFAAGGFGLLGNAEGGGANLDLRLIAAGEVGGLHGVSERGDFGDLPLDERIEGLDDAGEFAGEGLVAVLLGVVHLGEHFLHRLLGGLLLLAGVLLLVLLHVFGGLLHFLLEFLALAFGGGFVERAGGGGVVLADLLGLLLHFADGIFGALGEVVLLLGILVDLGAFLLGEFVGLFAAGFGGGFFGCFAEVFLIFEEALDFALGGPGVLATVEGIGGLLQGFLGVGLLILGVGAAALFFGGFASLLGLGGIAE